MNEQFRTYLFSYNYGGSNWNIEIRAESPEDAQQRVSRLVFATYQGEVVAKVPASLGAPVRLAVLMQNASRWLKRLL